ncbi:MAG TPA: hypothetical protein DEP20_00330, partial [Fusobacteria bacterium]|nr:hypothetical protein [Fusobacteriota bacterium]
YVDQNEQLILLIPINVGRRGSGQMAKKGDIIYLSDPDKSNKGKIRFVYTRGDDIGYRLAFSDIIVTRTGDKVEITVIPDTTTTSSTTSTTTSSSTLPRTTTTTTTTSSTTSTTSTSESTTTQKITTSSDKLTDSTTQLGTSTVSPVVISTTTTTFTIEGSSTTGSSEQLSTTTAPSTVTSQSSSTSSSSYIGAGVGGAAGVGLLGLVAYKARRWIFGSKSVSLNQENNNEGVIYDTVCDEGIERFQDNANSNYDEVESIGAVDNYSQINPTFLYDSNENHTDEQNFIFSKESNS